MSARRSKAEWARLVAYWLLTVNIAWEMALGGAWDLLRVEYVRVVMAHLGYPPYLLLILGVWKVPCALVLLAPRLPRLPELREWAYAGAFFNYSGAAASHALVGDPVGKWIGPAIFAAMVLGSWALRPPSRRLG